MKTFKRLFRLLSFSFATLLVGSVGAHARGCYGVRTYSGYHGAARGGFAYSGQHGTVVGDRYGVAATGPNGNVVVGRDVAVSTGWNGTFSDSSAIDGPYMTSIPDGIQPVYFDGYNCYLVNGNYFRPVFYGGSTVYVQVN